MTESLKKKTVKGVAWSTLERFSVAGVNFIFGLILARLLMPTDYGAIAMLSIFMAIAQTFIDSGFSNALIRKPDRTETDNATAFYFNIGVGLAAYFSLYLAAPYIAQFYKTSILIPLTRIMGLNLLLNSLCVVQQALLTARIDFKTQAKISLSAAIISGLVGIAFAYAGYGVWALAIQSVLASVIRTILLWILAKWRPKAKFSKQSFRNLFGYGSKLLASGLLDTIYNNLYTIVIGKRFSVATLGVYSRADQWANFLSVNITGILQRVTFPVLSTIQNEDERLCIDYRKFLRISGFVIFPLMMGLAAVADPLTRFILTDKWADSIPLLRILCFALMLYPIHAINLNLLQVKGRSDLFLRLEIYKKILGVATLCVTIPMGITAMCVGRVFTSWVALAMNTHYTGKLIHLGFFQQLKDYIPTLLNSFFMGAIVYGMTLIVSGSGLQLLAGVIIGASYYILSNYLLKTMEWKELILIIKRK
ncbi:polysaccharide biosynthesis protein [Tannerella sp. CAG:51]|uniref:lipopolysaccharide biosynthesis protein n=1 Tax=Coprobacter fastidiosus TaxID=1099853 RepID=UPI0003375241|nr:lipopolysaccharide biosynthesis protein [Coprobacter fastidiosus]CDD89894.1 polysaccharide biosynthesis protein [Tannerella sp. CAG:51]